MRYVRHGEEGRGHWALIKRRPSFSSSSTIPTMCRGPLVNLMIFYPTSSLLSVNREECTVKLFLIMNRDICINADIVWLSYCQQEKEDLSNIFTGKARREFCDCKKSPNQALTGAEIEGWELFVNSPLFGPCSPRHFPIPLAFKSGEGASV